MFEISDHSIDVVQLNAQMTHHAAGAFVCFEGRVRNNNDDRSVRGLRYESYRELAHTEGAKIVATATKKFGLEDARCVHRVGELELGDVAVWVGVLAGHREEAFAACRYIIDQIKESVPIWKHEHYVDGESGWVNAEYD